MNENCDLYSKLTKFIEETSIKQADDIKAHIKRELDDIKKTINSEIIKRTELEKELHELKDKYKILEKELRKNNIIIFNLGYKREDNILEFTVQTLNQLLQTDITKEAINNIYEIGKKKENRPIIVKFTTYLTKLTILKNCKKLKGTNISIAEELTLGERKKQKILRQHLKKARSKNLNAYIRGEKLYINGEEYKVEQLLENEEESESEPETNGDIVKKSSSAPPTPKAKPQEEKNTDEENREESGNLPKRRKFTTASSNTQPGRSSSRITERETRQATSSKNINSPINLK